MNNTIDLFIENNVLLKFDIDLTDISFYRIYPINDDKTIKLRISSLHHSNFIHERIKHNKIIVKIKILDDITVQNTKNEIIFNQKIQTDMPSNNIPLIFDIYKIDALSLKYILNKLPTRYIIDLLEFIRGEFLFIIYENYENLFHMGNDMMLINRMNQISTHIEDKILLFYSFLFYLVYYYNNEFDMSGVDIFNIAFQYVNLEEHINILSNRNINNITTTIKTDNHYFIKPIIVDYVGKIGKKNLFDVNKFMPFDNVVLYKFITENIKYPYLPIELIRNIFGDVPAYIITNLSWINANITDVNSQINYLSQTYDIYRNAKYTPIDKFMKKSKFVNNIKQLNDQQFNILMKCDDLTLSCMNKEFLKKINEYTNLEIVIKSPVDTNITNIGKIPENLVNFFRKYKNTYGTDIFGSNDNISVLEKFIRRICLSRYQYSQLKYAYLIAKSILEDNYDFFINFLIKQMNNIFSMFKEQLYIVNGIFRKDIFVLHFLTLTTDFTIPSINKFEHSIFLEESYIDVIYDFIDGIIKKGNIRNKLFIYLAFSKMLHYTLIRKLFLIFFTRENNMDTNILFKYGINNNKITMNVLQETNFNFDVDVYCREYGLNFNLISYRYHIIKELVPLKKDDIGTDNLKTYLFDVLDKNIKSVFLLYIYEDFKYGTTSRVRFDWNKIEPKDYILIPKYNNIIYPPVDIFEFYRQKNNYISFLDRGVDTQRMSVYDKDNIFIESYRKGEPVLAGASGHTADILLCLGYFEKSDNLFIFLNAMKIMILICVSVMFPRKDHSIFEMYRALQLFNKPFGTSVFTCPEKNSKIGSCFRWLLTENYYELNYNGIDYNFNGNKIYQKLDNMGRSFEYYLSVPYRHFIKDIVNIFYTEKENKININDLINNIAETKKYFKDFNHFNRELFIIMSIMRHEGKKLWMDDAEYAYNIELKHISMRNFINNNYPIPSIFTNDDIFLYEDNIVTCTRSVDDIIKPFDDFDNNCLILQKIYRTLSIAKCFR